MKTIRALAQAIIELVVLSTFLVTLLIWIAWWLDKMPQQ